MLQSRAKYRTVSLEILVCILLLNYFDTLPSNILERSCMNHLTCFSDHCLLPRIYLLYSIVVQKWEWWLFCCVVLYLSLHQPEKHTQLVRMCMYCNWNTNNCIFQCLELICSEMGFPSPLPPPLFIWGGGTLELFVVYKCFSFLFVSTMLCYNLKRTCTVPNFAHVYKYIKHGHRSRCYVEIWCLNIRSPFEFQLIWSVAWLVVWFLN